MTASNVSIPKNLILSFDIGHSSIGWAVLSRGMPSLLEGCGAVIFPPDMCLANVRRGFRRSRRNIAARRNRIKRLKFVLEQLGVLTAEELGNTVHSQPWMLAARELFTKEQGKLSWQEMWAVIRWYAHNRGYDGNALWAGDETDDSVDKEDTERVKKACGLMEQHNTKSMAETVCKILKIDPFGTKKSSRIYFKGERAAFDRNVVVEELKRILTKHIGVLPQMTEGLVRALCGNGVKDRTAYQAVSVEGLMLPSRFQGSLVFGQYVPRFDNRIIGKCRISGEKTPLKHCKEYYLYRWGRLLNNLTVQDKIGIRILSANERKQLHELMLSAGAMTKTELNKALRAITACEPANTEAYFMTEEMEKALVLDPVKKLIRSNTLVSEIWNLISARGQKIFASQLFKLQPCSVDKWIDQLKDWGEDVSAIEAKIEALKCLESKKKKGRNLSTSKLLKIEIVDGRASYSRKLMKQAFEECLAGKEPTAENGCLYETEAIRKRLLNEPLSEATNNHLVRHRLLIFERLLEDIVQEYASKKGTDIETVVVEVIRDLQEYSGLNAKEVSRLLGQKLAHHRMISQKLEKTLEDMGYDKQITAGLIRKARVLDDLGRECPYTGQTLSMNELLNDRLEVEHIIPRSLRHSDSLDSIVMTFREVNAMKGQRTAMEFIKQEQGKKIPNTQYEVRSLANYEKFVASLKAKGSSEDDKRRCKRRKMLLLTEKYEDRNSGFLNRDLTVTSHINKLAIRCVQQSTGKKAIHLPGQVTAFVRKLMDTTDCLMEACPRLQNREEKVTKGQLRDETHLHHALDAVTQGLSALIIPPTNNAWRLITARRLSEDQKTELRRLIPELQCSTNGDFMLPSLSDELRKSIVKGLKECRVVQHVPARMHGMKVDQTTWSIKSQKDDGSYMLEQKIRDEKGARGKKSSEEKPSKLLGLNADGKLKKIKGVVCVNENFGIALDPVPTVLPYLKVHSKLKELKEKNSGKSIRILRKGQIIFVPEGRYVGKWKILKVTDNAKSGALVDVVACDLIKVKSGTDEAKANVSVKTLLKDGMQILKTKLTGHVISHYNS